MYVDKQKKKKKREGILTVLNFDDTRKEDVKIESTEVDKKEKKHERNFNLTIHFKLNDKKRRAARLDSMILY